MDKKLNKYFREILSHLKKLKNSVNFKLSGVNLHMTESKKFLLNFFASEERTKAFSLTLFHSLTALQKNIRFMLLVRRIGSQQGNWDLVSWDLWYFKDNSFSER